MWCKIKVIGVWDTVSALAIPYKWLNRLLTYIPCFKHKFHNFKLCPCVENGYHALSIDEKRYVFQPILWDSKSVATQSMKQVWFCGAHSDVGGGYREQGLSDIALVWMIKMAKTHGLKIYSNHKVNIKQNICDPIHDETKTFPWKWGRKKTRSWTQACKPIVHESVLERKNSINTKYSPWTFDYEYEIESWDKN